MRPDEPEETVPSGDEPSSATEARGQGTTGEPADGLEPLLSYLRDARGFDFSSYTLPALERRIRRRMGEVGVQEYEEYLLYLEANPSEFAELFNAILINATSLFRDRPSWDYLQTTVVPELLGDKAEDEAIRVWSAGCASGEEVYTAAIVLLEVLGEERFKERVKIYGTDIDEEALATARSGTYPLEAFDDVASGFVEKYFVEAREGYSFRPDLRRSIVFGRNQLLQDAPISRLDLLICRNVLIYFLPDEQSEILGQFNFALRDHGVLFLGTSEMPVGRSDYFSPVETKWRVFRPVPRSAGSEIARGVSSARVVVEKRHAERRKGFKQSKHELEAAYEELRLTVDELESTNEELQSTNEELESTNEELQAANKELLALGRERQHYAPKHDQVGPLLEGILSNDSISLVVVDKEGVIRLWNSGSRELWGLRPDEVEGKAFTSLDIGVPLEHLREPLERALAGSSGPALTAEAVNRLGVTFRCEIKTVPLISAEAGLFGAGVLMRDLDAQPDLGG